MIVAVRLVRDRGRATAWWAFAMVLLIGSVMAIFPTIESNESFDAIVEDLPEPVRALIGSQADVPISSAPGYLQARLFSTVGPLVLLIFGIGLGARAIGGSEEDGTLELLLAHPISRIRVAFERVLGVSALVVALAIVFTATTLVLAPPFGLLDGVSITGLFAACAATGALALLHTALAFAAGAVTGRRGPAIAVATSVAIAGYVLYGFAAASESLRPLRFFTPWHWFLGRNMLVGGVAPESLVLPIALALALVVAGVVAFDRRDLRLAA